MRTNNRQPNALRPVVFTPGYCEFPAGSVLIETGKTRVLCNATVEPYVPSFLSGSGKGWVTAEYAMLPASGQERSRRDIASLKLAPRSAEIQRLIGRSLRSVSVLSRLDGYTVTVDCDVLQADGGTRTASITGGFLAYWLAMDKLVRNGTLDKNPIIGEVAAVSAGLVGGALMLDLDYAEDSAAEADFNMVMTADGQIVELQGTGEEHPFSREQLNQMLDMGAAAIAELCAKRRPFMRGAKFPAS